MVHYLKLIPISEAVIKDFTYFQLFWHWKNKAGINEYLRISLGGCPGGFVLEPHSFDVIKFEKSEVPVDNWADTAMYQSIPSLTIPRPGRPPGDSHILVVPGVGFSLLCFARGSAPEVLNQSEKFDKFEKKARFSLCFLNKWVAYVYICQK